jgi:hypothetical protein
MEANILRIISDRVKQNSFVLFNLCGKGLKQRALPLSEVHGLYLSQLHLRLVSDRSTLDQGEVLVKSPLLPDVFASYLTGFKEYGVCLPFLTLELDSGSVFAPYTRYPLRSLT